MKLSWVITRAALSASIKTLRASKSVDCNAIGEMLATARYNHDKGDKITLIISLETVPPQ